MIVAARIAVGVGDAMEVGVGKGASACVMLHASDANANRHRTRINAEERGVILLVSILVYQIRNPFSRKKMTIEMRILRKRVSHPTGNRMGIPQPGPARSD
jgi:hypothetical protein